MRRSNIIMLLFCFCFFFFHCLHNQSSGLQSKTLGMQLLLSEKSGKVFAVLK